MLVTLVIHTLLAGVALCDVSEKLRPGLSPSKSNYAGLEAPFESAASPVQTVKTQRSNRKHDDDNLERLCNDPFHSFLCKPVTVRRRRIDGRLRPGAIFPLGAVLPSGIVPEASNLQESSQPLESKLDPVRQGKSYLPPLDSKIPEKLIEPAFLPPGFLKKIEPPNAERTQETKISYSIEPNNRTGLVPFKTLKNIELLLPNNVTKTVQKVELNKLPRTYLPIEEAASPASSNLSPSIQNLPLRESAAQNRKKKEENHSLERLCNDPFHSFLCKPGKRRKRIDGRIRPEAKIPPTVFVTSRSSVRESRALRSPPRIARQPSNIRGARENDLPPNSKKQLTYQNQQSYIPPQDSFGYKYPKPSNNGTVTSDNGYIYQKPSDSLPSLTTESSSQVSKTEPTSPPDDISQDIVPPSSGYQYVQPVNGLPITTRPSQTTNTPVPDAVGTNSQQLVNSGEQNGYFYPKPSAAASASVEVIQTDPYSTVTPQKSTILQQSGTVEGYNYPKPLNPLYLPSTTYLTTKSPGSEITTTKIPTYQPPNTQNTAIPSGGYTYPKPTNNQQQSGYNYEKPSEELTLPSASTNPPTNALPAQTTPPPVSITTESTETTFGYQYPKPSNAQESIVSLNQTGYDYPKPSIGFTYPTTQRPEITQGYATSSQPTIATTMRPVISITTDQNPTTGYQYPQPTINQEISVPSIQSGYNYPKPSVGLTYPSENQQQTVAESSQTVIITTTTNPNAATSTIQNVPAASQTGYVYEKPSNSFTLPTKDSSISTMLSSSQTNINQNIVPPTQGGYVYEKPTYTTVKPPNIQTTPNSITTISDLQTTILKSSDSYQYPKPAKNPFQDGYQYPKPSQTLPQSTNIPSTLQTAQIILTNPTTQQSTTVGYQYTKPSSGPIAESQSQNGYVYEKPEISFTLPNSGSSSTTVQTTPAATTLITTKLTTGYEYPKPSNIQNNVVSPPKKPGYTYPKPSSIFTNPTTLPTVESYPTVSITTNVPSATNKPTTLQSLSTNNVQKEETGYNYQKPPISFTYPRPTTSYTFTTTSYTRPLNSFQYPKPNFPQSQGSATQNGYVYQRPSVPTTSTAEEGYDYKKPSNPLTLPTRQRSARNYRQSQQYQTQREFRSYTL